MAMRPESDPPVTSRPFQFGLSDLLVGCAVIALLAGLLIPAIRAARSASRRMECSSNLYLIGFGVRNYHDTYKCLPFAYTTGPSGKPWHDWRVRLSPFLESNPFFGQYSFNEPWTGPRNRVIPGGLTHVYSCPVDTGKSPSDTSYLAVVDSTTIWPGEQTTRFADVTDGTSNTIMVVETVNSGIHWLEPRDFDMGVARLGVNPSPGPGIGSNHRGGANFGFADGRVRFLSSDISPSVLESLLTKSGGEKVDLDAL